MGIKKISWGKEEESGGVGWGKIKSKVGRRKVEGRKKDKIESLKEMVPDTQ